MDHRLAPAAAGPLRATRITLGLALAACALAAGSAAGGCGTRAAESPAAFTASPAAPSAVGPTSQSPGPSAPASTAAPSARADVLAATAVVRRFCSLVDQRRYAAARRLLTAPSVWPLRELRAVRRMSFESAQAWGGPADNEVTLLVAFTAVVTWRSPLTGGINDVFFTLTRRVTTGEWLIAAVSTSP